MELRFRLRSSCVILRCAGSTFDNIPRIRTSVLTQNQQALEGLNYGADDFDLPIEDEVTQKAGATISLDFERILNYARELGYEPEYRHVSLGQPRWTDVS